MTAKNTLKTAGVHPRLPHPCDGSFNHAPCSGAIPPRPGQGPAGLRRLASTLHADGFDPRYTASGPVQRGRHAGPTGEPLPEGSSGGGLAHYLPNLPIWWVNVPIIVKGFVDKNHEAALGVPRDVLGGEGPPRISSRSWCSPPRPPHLERYLRRFCQQLRRLSVPGRRPQAGWYARTVVGQLRQGGQGGRASTSTSSAWPASR